MAVATIRDLDAHVHERLRERAKLHRRSVETEARVILDQALRLDREAVIRKAEAIRRSLRGCCTGDGTAGIRAERDRDLAPE
jgi:plasmid stability protein